MKKFALSRLNAAVMKGLCYSSVAATLAVAPHTLAQEEENDETASVERVMVTGSRIARDPNLASPSPVQSLDAEDVQLSGEFSITDIVNDIPALFSSVNGESSKDNGADFADGTNVLNLRGMGAERTLVLVNGRRHVAGVEGTGSVDIGSIPTKLIKNVEVLTGGASAVYGADAVTGVVNFILKDDFEGFDFDVQQGTSSEGDAQQTTLSALYGFNFDNDKGNVAISVEYAKDEGLRAGERDGGIFAGSATAAENNPAFRFQQGELGGNTPTFSQFFSPANGFANFGALIPTDVEDFLNDYEALYGSRPALTQAELALVARATTAFPRAIVDQYTFGLTSGYGMIGAGNPYTFAGWDPNTPIDLDHNGTPDCLDSATGSFATDVFAHDPFGYIGKYLDTFGAIGGCWFVTPDGNYRPIRDGIVLDNVNSGGGDSFNAIQQHDGYILIPEEKIAVNMIGSYEFESDLRLTGELKYAKQEVEDVTQPTSFWDLLYGAADNPFLPEFIRPVAEQTGGVTITIDPLLMGPGHTKTERETVRAALALDGYMENGWHYNVSLVWGKFERETTTEDQVIVDRFFAAIDAVTGPDGSPVCRADLDPDTPMITTPFELPRFDPGYYTFTPGSGQCQPLNIWAGLNGPSQAALDWVTTTAKDAIEIEQTVISGVVSGDLEDYFTLPAGSIAFALGLEYRDEQSTSTFDPWQRGILPAESPFGAGTTILEASSGNDNDNDNFSTLFDPQVAVANEVGSYDVTEIFGELQIPLLEGKTFAEELTLEVAARYSDYSSIGSTSTWKANLMWSPIEDLRIRSSRSQAVRAPNITELFGPVTGATASRNAEICSANNVENNPNREANCAADLQSIGVNPYDENGVYIWRNPLTARFSGTVSGNSELQEETADTLTLGFVYRPSWFEGFDITIDYWSIEIEDSIDTLSLTNIFQGCYDGPTLNNQFCSLFTRIDDPNSQLFGGIEFFNNEPINLARRESDGYDFSVSYKFDIDAHEFGVSLSGTKVNELNDFTNPSDLTIVDPELGEINRPEWAGNIFLDYKYGDLTVAWQTQYMDEQGVTGVEIENVSGYGDCGNNCLYGPEVIMDEFWQHDISASFILTDEIRIYGGIKNITDEQPFATEFAYPASPRGRFFFLGLNFSIE